MLPNYHQHPCEGARWCNAPATILIILDLRRRPPKVRRLCIACARARNTILAQNTRPKTVA